MLQQTITIASVKGVEKGATSCVCTPKHVCSLTIYTMKNITKINEILCLQNTAFVYTPHTSETTRTRAKASW